METTIVLIVCITAALIVLMLCMSFSGGNKKSAIEQIDIRDRLPKNIQKRWDNIEIIMYNDNSLEVIYTNNHQESGNYF